ncbi:LbtU family siderophore porin [Magnetococcus sp. PR-3]|uniref:LbtU family siderophore porin n=1 Tax=Magnetococcus sp. PR-3 TaxID=3120355 RepID=UPI002FCE36ED
MSQKMTVLATATLAATLAVPAQAGNLPSREEMWNIILQQQRQMEQLQRQHQETMDHQQMQLDVLKKQLGQTKVQVKAVEQSSKQSTSSGSTATADKWTDRITIGGQVRVQASTTENNGSSGISKLEDGSNVKVRLVELDIDTKINEWVTTSTALTYEHDGSTAFNVDTATVTVGNMDKFPVTLTMGKMTLPFGSYASSAIADPLTKELGEIGDTAAVVNFEMRGFTADFYLFNGDSQKNGDTNAIDQFGGNVGYSHTGKTYTASMGLHFVNSVENSGGISTAISAIDSMTDMADYSSAWGVNASVTWRNLTFLGEYVQLLDPIASSTTDTDWNNTNLRPSAWHGEISYSMPILDKQTNFAISYSGSDASKAVGLVSRRLALHANVDVIDNTTVQMEWSRDFDYEATEGGSGNDADTATLRLKVSF